MQDDVRGLPELVRIGRENDIHPLCGVAQIEMGRFPKTARAERSEPALACASARHIEFINNFAAGHISDFDVQRQKGTSAPKYPKKKRPSGLPPSTRSNRPSTSQPTRGV